MTRSDDDRALLQSSRRRNLMRTLPVMLATVGTVWLGSTWLTRVTALPLYAVNAALLVALVVAGELVGDGPSWLRRLTRREDPRSRWLHRDASERKEASRRRLRIGLMALMLVCLLTELWHGFRDHGGTDDKSALLVGVSGLSVAGLTWRQARGLDELDHAHRLLATQRAWTTCVLMLLTALVIDSRWGGHLPVLVAIALLCAMLTQQYSLARSARAAIPVDE
jgi:hypothetical protein